MQVTLLRNLYEEQTLSMKLYADRLSQALHGRCQMRDRRPWTPPLFPSRPRFLARPLDYTSRFCIYPLSLLGASGDVFHIVDHAYAHLVQALPARRTVVTCHDVMLLKLAEGEFGRQPVPRVATALLRYSLHFLRQAAMVIAASHATAEDLVERLDLPRAKVRVVHHGVDPLFRTLPAGQSRNEIRARLGFASAPLILHVGNNWFYKNVDGVIRAFAAVHRGAADPKPVLARVGTGFTPGQRDLARRLGVLDAIREFGVIATPELQQFYWAADVLVFPSLWEGFGWPPLEAMASGTPVVSSHAGALQEVVGDAAEVVEAQQPDDIARGISRVLQDEQLRHELVGRGLERVQQFTWEAAAGQVYRIYEEVVRENQALG